MPKKLAIGTVARCKAGRIGLITSITGRYNSTTGKSATLYKGACLGNGHIGSTWESIDPEPIGTLDEWVKLRAGEF